ncbi:MAG: transglutaminase domain-containing protein, partial [Solirubrobacteraceae bacterium]
MSAGASLVTPAERTWNGVRRRDQASASRVRPWVRLTTFTALAGYGLERWGTLLRPAPGWRLVGLLVVAVALAGAIPVALRRSRPAGTTAAAALLLLAFPVAGLRWEWFTHVRIAVSADRIGSGLQALPNALVPYLGTSHAVELVIVLGGAVLLLDAAAVLAFSPASLRDGRRAAAALPLTALAIVPSTLVAPQWPYVQGLLLFVLLAAFLWGERVRRQGVAAAVGMVAVAGVAGAIIAPRIDQGRPWVNYRAWAGTLVHARIDTFNWNQTYGPLRWPRTGHEVLTVQARAADYWKAANLDTFDGYSWIVASGTATAQPALPPPSADAVDRWTQTLRVSILGLRTSDVVAAGYAGAPSAISGGLRRGADAGTWIAGRALGPGTTYDVSTYSPHPSPQQLARAGSAQTYPATALAPDLTLGIPASRSPVASIPQVAFPVFHTRARPTLAARGFTAQAAHAFAAQALAQTPYAGAYTVARRLAAGARTPYAFVADVEHYLAHGFRYDENPPNRAFPLESFLLTDKLGYCQQFSGAMAMLLRMGGVPARVASGFTTGTYDRPSHRWVVSDTDAHAWVEAWFPRYGWVRFDPTPASAPARGGTTAPAIIKGDGSTGSSTTSALRRDVGAPTTSRSTARHHSGADVSPWLIVLGVAAGGALGWLLWRRGMWRRRGDDPLAELERALARTRRPLRDGVTLNALERRLGPDTE